MNIEELKETLGDKYDGLKSYVDEIIGQRDAARNESINGRKTLKARVAELEALQTKLFDKLGLDSPEDIDSLPDGKGQAEAVKQFEAKVKRLERELAEEQQKAQGLTTQLRESTLNESLQKALGAHDWLDRDVAATILKSGIVFEDDTHQFKTEKGLIPIDDAAKLIAQEKSFLLKSSGAGGSGYKGNNGNGSPPQGNVMPKPSDFADEKDYHMAVVKFKAEAANSQ